MLYYILFWTLLGFIIHFYIIFGTNLLTGGPAQNCCFCLFQGFEEKEYQTESKRNETFGNVIFGMNVIQRTWTLRQDINQEGTRWGRALHSRGGIRTLLVHLRCSMGFFWSRNNLREFSGQLDSVWYSFSAILKNMEKQKLTLGSRLIG